MWELPSAEVAGDVVSEDQLTNALIKLFDKQGYQIVPDGKWTEVRHVFSHREWRLSVWRCSGAREDKKGGPGDWRWIDREEARLMNWAGPYRKISDAWMNANDEVEG
jgi:A/G-specific adenine glycosylase